MTYFLFNKPGEKTVMLFSYQKKEELGTACFYNTHISWTRNQSKTWPALSIKKKNGRTRTEKGAVDEENNSPLPRFLNSEPAKERR